MKSSKNPYLTLLSPSVRSSKGGLFPPSQTDNNPDIKYDENVTDLYSEAEYKESSIPSIEEMMIKREKEKPIIKMRRKRRVKKTEFTGRADPSKSFIYIIKDNNLDLLRNLVIYKFPSEDTGKIIPVDVLLTKKERIFIREKRKKRGKKLVAEYERLHYSLIEGDVYNLSSECELLLH